MTRRPIAPLATLFLVCCSQSFAADEWLMQRGEWKQSGETITCDFDAASYKKYKDHGPIITKPFVATDAMLASTFTINPSNEADDTQSPRVVLTFDGKKGTGHVLRLILFTEGDKKRGPTSRAIAWAEGTKKATPIIANGKMPRIKVGEEVTVSITTDDETATITLNGETFTATHPGIAREKSNGKLGFAFGDIVIDSLEAGPAS